jgi:hypothetical protein
MLKHRLPALLIMVVCSVTASGCLYSREISHVKRDIERQYPEIEFDRGVSVNLGRNTLRSLGWLARRVPEEDAQLASAYLQQIQFIKVGYFPIAYLPELDETSLDLPSLDRFEQEGWEVAVKVRDDDELVWVLYRERFDAVRDLYVLVLNDDELVVATLRGQLDHLLDLAIEDFGQFGDIVGL